MTSLDIKVNIKKLSNYSAIQEKDIDKKTLLTMIEYFSAYLRGLYLTMIEESIYSRRYQGKWEPVEEEGYREYIGVTPVEDILSILASGLEYKKIGYNFIVRFNPSYKYPGSKIPLIRVLRAIESGTSKFNARPILAKNARMINAHIMELWRGFLVMKGVV